MDKEQFQDIVKNTTDHVGLSRLERRKNLSRLQRKRLFDEEQEQKEDNLFIVKNKEEASGTVTRDRYKIKKSLSTGTLRLGEAVVAAKTRDSQLIVLQPPQGLQIPPASIPKRTKKTTIFSLVLEIQIGFV